MLMPVSYIQVNGNRITELVNYVMMLVALQSDFPYKDSKKKKKKVSLSFFLLFYSTRFKSKHIMSYMTKDQLGKLLARISSFCFNPI